MQVVCQITLRLAVRGCLAAMLLASAPLAAAQGAALPSEAAAPADFSASIDAAKAAMMADPAQALEHALGAKAAASADPGHADRDIMLATAGWLQAEALIRLNHPREAEPVVNQALETIGTARPGSKLNGDLLMTRASLAAVLGEVRVALLTYQDAHNVYQAIGEDRGRAIALQNIGSIYSDARDHDRVLKYYAQSAEAYSGDPALDLSTYNNRGFAYLELRQFGEAEIEFGKALDLARREGSAVLEVRILTNVAMAQLGAGKLAEADATATAALQAGKSSTEGWEPFLWGVRAEIAFTRGDAATAGTYIERTFDGLEVDATTMPFREFHEAAYKIYEALGNATKALDHIKAFKRLDDEARNVAASTNSALAAAQFDFANQELNIAKLKSGQLERDIQLAALNSRFLYSLLIAVAAMLAISLVALFWIQRSRNQTREANAQLSLLNADLDKALQARTRFLAMTSHEMRTPLNGILGMTQVLLADRTVQGALRENIEIVHKSGHAMKALVDDILDVAKIESGNLVLEEREFDLRNLLDGVINLWRLEAADKRIALRINLGACPTAIRGDEQRVRQIAYNLISNAIKFTEAGEVTIEASTETRNEEERLILRVSDTGIGIPANKFDLIFESFQQVDASVSRRFGGTGLGLSVCRSLTKAMKGSILVESVLGQGSTFTVDLPLQRAAQTETGTSSHPVQAGANCLLIILANPLTQAVLRNKLASQFDAIAVLDTWPPRQSDIPAGIRHVLLDIEAIGDEDEFAGVIRFLREQRGVDFVTTLLPAAPPPALLALSKGLADTTLCRPLTARDIAQALQQRDVGSSAGQPGGTELEGAA
jgi:signal transduction histidine kinase